MIMEKKIKQNCKFEKHGQITSEFESVFQCMDREKNCTRD